ncbi:MAG: AI-2E family transporter [Mucilaginibacter polytrichastri]|nr:AI-2E family transporter [Mucilaginibacter polytrichastri]
MAVFSTKQRNNIILIILILLGAFLLFALRSLFSAILGGVVLYTIFRQPFIWLVYRKKWPRGLTAVMVIIFSLVVIIIPFLSLSIMVINKISKIKTETINIKRYIAEVEKFAGSRLNQPHLIDDAMQRLGNFATQLFPSILGSAAAIFLTLAIMYFLMYFMFVEDRKFEKGLLHYSPFKKEHSLRFASELRNSTYSNVLGQGLIAVVQGGLLALSYWITGTPDAIFWGVIGTFLSFIPIVGAPMIGLGAGIIALFNGQSWQGIFLIAFAIVIISNIDNVLRLIINRKLGNVHPIITIIGVIIGLPVFGILGLVFGPLLISYFLLLIEIYEQNVKEDEGEDVSAVIFTDVSSSSGLPAAGDPGSPRPHP